MDVIDDAVAELDRGWQARPYDDECLKRLLEAVPLTEPQREAVLVELCAADMEWRWRTSQHIPLPMAGDNSLSGRPQAMDYQRLLGPVWGDATWRRQLVLAEWKSRSAVGDRPSIEAFLKGDAAELCDADELLDALEEIAQVRVTIFEHEDEVSCSRFPPRFVLGRQHQNEPAPPGWTPSSRKLVVAAATDTRISRNQLEIERTQVREFMLTNMSSKVAMDLNGETLAPKQAKTLTAPFCVGILKVRVQVAIRNA